MAMKMWRCPSARRRAHALARHSLYRNNGLASAHLQLFRQGIQSRRHLALMLICVKWPSTTQVEGINRRSRQRHSDEVDTVGDC